MNIKQLNRFILLKTISIATFTSGPFQYYRNSRHLIAWSTAALLLATAHLSANERTNMIHWLSPCGPKKKLATIQLPESINFQLMEEEFADYNRMQCEQILTVDMRQWYETKLANLIVDLSSSPTAKTHLLHFAARTFTDSIPLIIEAVLLPLIYTHPSTPESLTLIFRVNFAQIPQDRHLFIKRCRTLVALAINAPPSSQQALTPQIHAAVTSLNRLFTSQSTEMTHEERLSIIELKQHLTQVL